MKSNTSYAIAETTQIVPGRLSDTFCKYIILGGHHYES